MFLIPLDVMKSVSILTAKISKAKAATTMALIIMSLEKLSRVQILKALSIEFQKARRFQEAF